MFKRNEKKRTIKTFFSDELQFSRFKQNREEQQQQQNRIN